ncbi:hypothetical protein E2562_035165 [Oryza meyeriana var. granulata]|uniref:Uncharacterized protein n=1 Tax=Oryza meyeriana var. granulata TaxID=110450 RepID=A0A6G1E7P0_9ORYZ|nr:hypothetical protein E2562_035165 [Oryza meyeriana var. granulata]
MTASSRTQNRRQDGTEQATGWHKAQSRRPVGIEQAPGQVGRDGGEADGWAASTTITQGYRSGEDGDGEQARLAGSPVADEGDDRRQRWQTRDGKQRREAQRTTTMLTAQRPAIGEQATTTAWPTRRHRRQTGAAVH